MKLSSNTRDSDSVNRILLRALQILVSKPRFRRFSNYREKEALYAYGFVLGLVPQVCIYQFCSFERKRNDCINKRKFFIVKDKERQTVYKEVKF